MCLIATLAIERFFIQRNQLIRALSKTLIMKKSHLYLSLAAVAILLSSFAITGKTFELNFDFSWVKTPKHSWLASKPFYKASLGERQKKMSQHLRLSGLDLDAGSVKISKGNFTKNLNELIDILTNPNGYHGQYNEVDSKGALKGRYYNHIASNWSEDEHEFIFANTVSNLDREASSLKAAFDVSKSIIFATISKDKYESNSFGLYTDNLIKTYEHITSQKGWEKKFDGFTDILKNENRDSDYCGIMMCPNGWDDLICPDIKNEFHSPDEGDNGDDYGTYVAYRDVMWFHSFWYRRYMEGNMDVVLKILKEIKENYK